MSLIDNHQSMFLTLHKSHYGKDLEVFVMQKKIDIMKTYFSALLRRGSL